MELAKPAMPGAPLLCGGAAQRLPLQVPETGDVDGGVYCPRRDLIPTLNGRRIVVLPELEDGAQPRAERCIMVAELFFSMGST